MIIDVLQVIEEKLTAMIKPELDSIKLVLVDLKIQRRSSDIYIQLIADHPHGGITLDECMSLNKNLSQKIEDSGLLEEGFSLEVSSPGLDRPLKSENDFKRVIKREVRFYLAQKVDDKLEHIGKIMDVNQNQVIISTSNGELSIPLNIINKAYQVIQEI